MQTQHLSEVYPNMISITQVRKDIDSLLTLLDKYPEVKVLRGQTILFTAHKSESVSDRQKRIKDAIVGFEKMKKKYKKTYGASSASEWIIKEREKILSLLLI